MTYIQPFDVANLIVNHLAGSSTIFTFLAFIIIPFLCGLFRIPDKIFLPILGLFVVMFAIVIGNGLYVLAVVVMSIAVAKLSAKLFGG